MEFSRKTGVCGNAGVSGMTFLFMDLLPNRESGHGGVKKVLNIATQEL
jgi:hypothetical protein